MIVEIFHNVASDDRGAPVGIFGYQPTHPVVKVYEFPAPCPRQHH